MITAMFTANHVKQEFHPFVWSRSVTRSRTHHWHWACSNKINRRLQFYCRL